MASNYIAIRVLIGGKDTEREWTGLRLNLANAKHAVGYVTMRHYLGNQSRNSGRTFYRSRSRIRIEWGEFPGRGLSNVFLGYIDSHRAGPVKVDGNGRYINVSYYVMGTSRPMQVKHNWTGRSWSQAAKAIARRHKLRPIVHQTPRLTKPLIQSTSDFKFLVEGAKKTGYRFFVWGPNLYFVNPQKMLNSRPDRTPLFEDDAILNIDVDAAESEASVYAVLGTSATGQTIMETSSYDDGSQDEYWDEEPVAPKSVEYDQMVVESLAEAQQAVQARVLSDVDWVTAEVEAVGDARVLPGTAVYLTADDLADEHKGLWIVNSVSHIVDLNTTQSPKKSYQVEMKISRDRLRALTLPERDGEAVWRDVEDPEESVPWESSEEWLSPDDNSVTSVEGVWQAGYYGEDDSQLEYAYE